MFHSLILSCIAVFVSLQQITGTNAGISDEQLAAIMPLTEHLEYLEHINFAMDNGDIKSCERIAAFLAQLAQESGELQYMEELASGEDYEGVEELGNTQPGDGVRYKGRGPIQLTGRANYQRAGDALKMDLVGDPAAVAKPEIGFQVAVWFWNDKGLSPLADKNTLDAFRQITQKINGGQNGAAIREKYWNKAREVIGCVGRKKRLNRRFRKIHG